MQAVDGRQNVLKVGGFVRHEGGASIEIAARAEAVWAVVSDVTRVGQWSGECRGCSWIGGSSAVAPGARFRGRNRRGGLRWSRLNEVVVVERPHELVWRTLPSGPYPDSVEWRLRLTEGAGSTRVEESFRIVKIPRLMDWVITIAFPPHRDRGEDLASDLTRLKALVESSASANP